MPNNSEFETITFDLPKNQSNVIKVIGVGGGGSNAINHMFKQGIKGVDFMVCNTDSQALQNSPVPNKIQLGVNLTEGLGAGANPDVGQQSAIESIADIEKMLDCNTKMVFITAGMGGGTGTGAAPVIAQLAKERDILTVGIVTLPFTFEGKVRHEQAIIGIEKLRKQVDSLIIINNNKLREVYGNLGFKAGFSKADEVLATASRGIAEVITHHYTQNIDLRDAKTVLHNSGTAIMGSATASGENRAKEAIISALDSPLLNDNKITGAKNVLLLIVSGANEITIDEIGEINDHIQSEAGHNANIIMGVGEEESLGDAIAVTIIATGFNPEQQSEIVNTEPKKIIHTLEEEQKSVIDLTSKSISTFDINEQISASTTPNLFLDLEEEEIVTAKKEVVDPLENLEYIQNLNVDFEIVSPKQPEFIKSESIKLDQIKTTKEEQATFSFDLPLFPPKQQTAFSETKETVENTVYFNLNQENIEEDLTQSKQFVPITELSDQGVIKYSLEEYMEAENTFSQAKPKAKTAEEIPAELQITKRKINTPPAEPLDFESLSPIDMTIEDTLRLRADERRKKLKEFNYKFHDTISKIDELEKEPAYKRLGLDLSSNENKGNNHSRISVISDGNNELQLRSNNSFLHDNVD